MRKKRRFNLDNYYPDLPGGWALYSESDLEGAKATHFILQSLAYRKKFLSGDENAIYEFIRNNKNCFREIWRLDHDNIVTCYANNNILEKNENYWRSWVIEQIEKWQEEGSAQSKKKLKKLFATYIDGRGRKGESETDRLDNLKAYIYIKKAVENGMTVDRAIEDLSKECISLGIPSKGELTYREIYYGLKALEDDKKTTEGNLRFEYFFRLKNISINEKYRKKFRKELSLYLQIEQLINESFSRPPLSLPEALKRISKKGRIAFNELNELYTIYKRYESLPYGKYRMEALAAL